MKRFLSIVVVSIGFMMCLFACTTENNDNTFNPTDTLEIPDAVDFSDATEQQLAIYFDLAKEALETYYMAAIAQKPFPSFTISTTEYCQKYIQMKFKYESRFAKEAVALSFELKKWKIVDDSLWCNISMLIEFRYRRADFTSSISGPIQLIIENPKKPAIADWYDGDSTGFDAQARWDGLDLSLEENSLYRLSSHNIDDILNEGQKVLDSIR
ncbi:MAG: hypothetical protein FWG14_12455 [Peptococcaceae bacterium]|nr:hypothetical protein [Peptococcaceae bacterium]